MANGMQRAEAGDPSDGKSLPLYVKGLGTRPENYGPGEERIVRTFCRPNCFGGCPIYAHVRDGKVVKTSPAPLPDPQYNRVCLRGLSHAEQMYSDRRLTHPMKRVGERGSGKWQRITWDEAISTVVDKIQSVQAEYGNQAVAYTEGSGNYGILTSSYGGATSRFFSALQATTLGMTLDVAQSHGVMKVFGTTMANDIADIANADTILIVGANVSEAHIHVWHFVMDALEMGAKMYVVDPVYTATAARASQWVRSRPGSDAAMFMAMMKVIFDEGLENTSFIHDSTVGPLLVRSNDHQFLRRSHVTGIPAVVNVDPATGMESVDDPYMVWGIEATGFIEAGTENASVSGSYSHDGVELRPALDLLKEAVQEYTLEYAEEITLIEPEILREMAIRYAKSSAATIYHAMGFDHWDNGHLTAFAEASLAAITGNVGRKGSSIGFGAYAGDNLDIMNWLVPDGKFGRTIFVDDMFEVAKSGTIMDQPDAIKMLYVAGCNVLGAHSDRNQWINSVLPSLDFIVTVDIFNSDIAEYSDLVLPAAHWFERSDAQFWQNHPFIMYGEKAVEPLGESKPDIEILRLLAEPLGLSKYFPDSDDEMLEISLNKAWAEQQGFSFDRLKREGAVRVRHQDSDEPNIAGPGYGAFPTATGRAEFYNPDPKPRVQSTTSVRHFEPATERLPNFQPPLEAWPGTEISMKYPLVFFQEHTRWRVHTQWAEAAWLRELDPEPTVKINPHDADARGIRDGDDVEIYNDRGHVVVKALLSTALPEGMLSLPKGWLAHQHKVGAPSELTHLKLNASSINQSYFDVAVEVRVWKGEE